MIVKNWLPGWNLGVLSAIDLFRIYERESGHIIKIGQTIFELGVMPQINSDGWTGGNIAIRDPFSNSDGFIVTGSGTHKGQLKENKLVIVTRVDWNTKEVYSFQDDSVGLKDGVILAPSTDALLAAQVFKEEKKINVWIHFHLPVNTYHEIALNYPSTTNTDWQLLVTPVVLGIRTINLIDHDLSKKEGKPNGKPDSAIVLGSDSEETLALAVKLIKESPHAPRHS